MKQDEKDPSQPGPPRPGQLRRPYQKPSFRHEKIFETMALSCGKISTTQGACHFNLKSS
jgi:hypothetical protein